MSLPIISSKQQFGPEKWHYVYILRCADNTLYTGWTNNIAHRLYIHNIGQGAKYTKSRLPVKLVYWEVLSSKQEAMKREYQIKRYTRAKKLKLIKGDATAKKGGSLPP